MSDYLAKQMFGEDAIYGMARFVVNTQPEVNGVNRVSFGGIFLSKTEKLDFSDFQLTDAEIYVKPMRTEPFRGNKGGTIQQAMFDFHFQNAFGECVTEEHSYCSSCEERGLKTKKL